MRTKAEELDRQTGCRGWAKSWQTSVQWSASHNPPASSPLPWAPSWRHLIHRWWIDTINNYLILATAVVELHYLSNSSSAWSELIVHCPCSANYASHYKWVVCVRSSLYGANRTWFSWDHNSAWRRDLKLWHISVDGSRVESILRSSVCAALGKTILRFGGKLFRSCQRFKFMMFGGFQLP